MATKLVRQTLYQFGSTVNGASEVGVYGSGATGSPSYTSSITLMQSLGAWSRGWAAETIANNRPFLEDMNAVDCVFGYQLSYMMQMGIPEYDTTGNSVYFLNSICQSGGIVYQVINDNGGAGISATAPGNLSYWITLQMSGQVGIPVSKSGTTVYQAATDGMIFAVFNGETVYGTISIGPTSTPTAFAPTFGINNNTNLNQEPCGSLLVPKGWYYEVTVSGGSVTSVEFTPIGK